MDTAILFLIFNRPEPTQVVFESIRKIKPRKLYISADGPRISNSTDNDLCKSARKIETQVDWECEVKTLFRDENLGCANSVSSAISWFFDQEDKGIILEDDCLPDQTFYKYSSELLTKYENIPEVMLISGDYFLEGIYKPKYSYSFSRYNHCWGWASWKDSWSKYDHDMAEWPQLRNSRWLRELSDNHSAFVTYWTYIFDLTYRKKIDSWAYRWLYSCWLNNGLTIVPSKNLVKNLGFGIDATHTTSVNSIMNKENSQISFPLHHPEIIKRDLNADLLTEEKIINIKPNLRSTILMKTGNYFRNYF